MYELYRNIRRSEAWRHDLGMRGTLLVELKIIKSVQCNSIKNVIAEVITEIDFLLSQNNKKMKTLMKILYI